MTSRQFFSSAYALMCREAGSRTGMEEQLEDWAKEHDFLMARNSREVPESVAKEQLALMGALGGPAPLKEGR